MHNNIPQDTTAMAQSVSHPQLATLNRSLVVQSLIQRVFGVTYGHLSQLRGRTIAQYCKDEVTVPKYITKFFTSEDNEVLSSTTLPEEYDVKLSYKCLKTCCGLSRHDQERWGSEKAKDTFEFLITFCWTEYLYLQEASSMTDDDLNLHMDKVLEALVFLIKKVEEKKKVAETSLKETVTEHVGGKLEPYDDASCPQHMCTILCEHLVHQMLVMVYIHLNQLNGASLSNYLKRNKMNLVPRTLFSNERKFLEENPPPQRMSVNILYRVVERVCFRFDARGRRRSSDLECILHNLKKEYKTSPRNEQEHAGKCYKVFELLQKALTEVCRKTGKTRRLVVGNLAKEPFVVESFQKPLELPGDSTECLSALPKTYPTTPGTFSPAMAHTLPVAGTLTVEEVNVCLLHRVMDPGGLVTQTLTLIFKALKGELESPEKKKELWKNAFTQEKQVLRACAANSMKVEDLSKGDVTLLYKLLRHACPSLSTKDNDWVTNSDMLEYHITTIKNERNKLAHERSSIRTEELKNTLKIIEDSLDTILEKAESKLGDNEHDVKRDLQNQRDKVKIEMQKNSQTLQAVPFNYPLNMKNMIQKVKEVAQQELRQPHLYRESLEDMSAISGHSDPRHKALTTRELFVHRDLEDRDDIRAQGLYKVEDILFCQNTALASFRVFIIHGRPGEGKTCICKHAFRVWSGNVMESSQKGLDLLIYIPCRHITTKSLSAYLKGKLPQTFAGSESNDVILLLQVPKILFMIDDYDDAGEEAKSFIHEILTSFPNSRVLITTKPHLVPKIEEKVNSVTSWYKILSIMEMTEEKIHQCVGKIFSALRQETEDCNRFLKYLDEMKEDLNPVIHRPLTFSLLALLWIEEHGKAKKIRTLAELYNRLMDLILERVTKQLGKSDPFYCREWMIKLGEVGWQNFKKNKHYLSEQDQTSLKRKAHELGLGVEGNNHIISSLLHCEVQDSMVTTQKKWTFTLTSQQEYFAAEYIVDALKEDKTITLNSILELPKETSEQYKKSLQRVIPVLEFICGLLVIHDGVTEARVTELMELMSVKEPWSFTALEKMFKYLLQENSKMEKVLQTMFTNQEMNTFDRFAPQSTLWVLRNTSLAVPRDVTVINAVSDILHIKPLLDFLLLETCCIKVMVDVDRVTDMSSLVTFIQRDEFKDITFTFMAWKPCCISELVMKWPYSRPLCLSLLPEVLPLVWWECLMCLLTMKKQVSKIVCSQADEKCFNLMKEGAIWLNADIVTDHSLAPTDVVIVCH